MSEIQQLSEHSRCYCCLSTNSQKRLQIYNIENKNMKLILRMDYIVLCYVCKKIAEKVDMFMNNVERHQTVLEQITDASQNLDTSAMSNGIIELTHTLPDIMEFGGNDELYIEIKMEKDDTDETMNRPDLDLERNIKAEWLGHHEMSNNDQHHGKLYEFKCRHCGETNKVTLQKQLPEIPNASLPSQSNVHFEGPSYERFEAKVQIKEESDEWPVGGELPNDYKELTSESESDSSDGGIKSPFQDAAKEMKNLKIDRIFITKEQCMEERRLKTLEPKYVEATYKCEDCIQIFSIKETFEAHLELHKESSGRYECDICKRRTLTATQLSMHYKYHTERFKCSKCDYIGKGKLSAKDHYVKHHCSEDYYPYACKHCGKQYRFNLSLKNHVWTKHAPKREFNCSYCEKSYPIKSSLRDHIFKKHANAPKKYVCDLCGMGYAAKYDLKRHMRIHSDQRDHHCVKCNKSFKTEAALRAHFLSRIHSGEFTLPFPCSQCDKAFRARRDLTRHVNGFHLNIRPFKCEQCDKAFKNLNDAVAHRKRVHEGYRSPKVFECTLCLRIFKEKQSLEAHIRTHTGERPFQCSQCTAQFTHSGSLHNHTKLVHLKLTRKRGTKGKSTKSGNTK